MGVRRIDLVVAAMFVSSCGGDAGRRDDVGGSASIGSLSGITASGDDDSGGGDDGNGTDGDGEVGDGTPIPDLGGASLEAGMDECAEVIEEADVGKQGADIIIVIDNSVSMFNEIASVQENMNAFSQQIIDADVDPHVIMVSGFPGNSDSGICVPPPLGSGLCPNADHNPPTYWRVGMWVGSHSSLSRVVE
jgi:hypothetical protein